MSWEILGPDKMGQSVALPSAHHLGRAHVLFRMASSKVFSLHSVQLSLKCWFRMSAPRKKKNTSSFPITLVPHFLGWG